MSAPSVIFAGGGTGGHIFPALAIAEALRRQRETADARTVMIGSDRPLDAVLLGGAVERGELDAFAIIRARPFGVRPRAAWGLLKTWGACVRETRLLIRDERERGGASPVLVAMGGFVSAAPVRAAITERCPVLLVNLDSVPGKANRWIAHRADERLTVGASGDLFEPMEARAIHPIVRPEIRACPEPESARLALGLDPVARTLLVTGGSQGARTVNAFLTRFADAHAALLNEHGWQVLHQSGAEDAEAVDAIYRGAGVRARVLPFIDDIASAWGAATVSVCRAGAGTVAEAWATRTPSLFLPYPFHKDAHQRANAAWLTDRGAGVLGDDRIDTEANLVHNGPLLAGLLRDETRRASLRDMLQELGPADGADQAARAISGLVG